MNPRRGELFFSDDVALVSFIYGVLDVVSRIPKVSCASSPVRKSPRSARLPYVPF